MGFDFARGVDPELVLIDDRRILKPPLWRLESRSTWRCTAIAIRSIWACSASSCRPWEFLAVLSEFGYELFDPGRLDPPA